MVAQALKDQARSPSDIRTKFMPSKNTSSERGKMWYDPDHKPKWMNSSIDLSQPRILNVGSKPDVRELNTSQRFHIKECSTQKSAGFKPIFQPYAWKPKKLRDRILNNSVRRTSDTVNPKVTEISHDRNVYTKRYAFRDPRARASELLRNAGQEMERSQGREYNQIVPPIPSTRKILPQMNSSLRVEPQNLRENVRY